jgi:alpha-beta hydrolase superfamily lysophospholipase
VQAVAPELIRLPEGGTPIREVFLTLPGLNFNPDRLEPWEALFVAQGAAVVRPALRGYAGAGDPTWRDVSAEGWLEDISEAYIRAAQRFAGAKISLFGFSLGGVLGLVWAQRTNTPLHRAVLLAPALGSRRLPWMGLRLCTLLPGRMLVKSWAPRAYRVHAETSLAAYQAVRKLIREFRQSRRAGKTAYDPGALFTAVAGRDELVSAQAVDQYRAELAKTRPQGFVRMHWIDHQPKPGWMVHLGVDAFTLGETPWEMLRANLEEWLAATAP